MCDKAVSEDLLVLKYYLDRYKTQEMRDKAVDDFLVALKFLSDWLKNLHNALFTDDVILLFDEDSRNVMFSNDEIGILSIDLNLITLTSMMLIFWKWFWNYYSC